MTPTNVRTAIVLMKRAPLTGEEAISTADAITAFEALYNSMTAPPTTEEDDGNDS